MIFLTVGSAEKGIEFDRLIKAMDQIAGEIEEPVTMQIGSSDYRPRHADYFSYKKFDEMLSHFQTAKLIVGHCGSGTVLNAFQAGVPLIVVPRTHALGEVDTDNHQALLAGKIENLRGVRAVYDVEKLGEAVKEMLSLKYEKGTLHRSQQRESLLSALREFILKNEKCRFNLD